MTDDLLPEALQAMHKHAQETLAQGDLLKAEAEYMLMFEYASKVYHPASATTGLVLMKMADFYEATKQTTKAAITVSRVNAILEGYRITSKN